MPTALTMSEIVSELRALGARIPASGRFRSKAEGLAKLQAARQKAETEATLATLVPRHERGTLALWRAIWARPRLRNHPGLSKAARRAVRREIRRWKRERRQRAERARAAAARVRALLAAFDRAA